MGGFCCTVWWDGTDGWMDGWRKVGGFVVRGQYHTSNTLHSPPCSATHYILLTHLCFFRLLLCSILFLSFFFCVPFRFRRNIQTSTFKFLSLCYSRFLLSLSLSLCLSVLCSLSCFMNTGRNTFAGLAGGWLAAYVAQPDRHV